MRRQNQNQKHKHKQRSNNFDDDDDYEEFDYENVLADDNIYTKDNNIYFYSDVTTTSCLKLIKYINKLTENSLITSIKYNIPPPPIYLHLQSYGGEMIPAYSVVDHIQNNKVPIESIIEGTAASAATLISLVCHKRRITRNSYMLIHQMSTTITGTIDNIIDDCEFNTKLMNAMKNIYIQKTILKQSDLDLILQRDKWWNSIECLEKGLVDTIDYMNENEIEKELRELNKRKKTRMGVNSTTFPH